jgi:nitroreductase
VDTYLAVVSRRDERRYDQRPLAPETLGRILDAGRLAGSARNRQPWRFHILEGERKDQVAEAVYAPGNVQGAAVAVAVTISGKGPTSFDAGRAAQNMLLTAWNEGVASCPNGIADAELVTQLLGVDGEEERPVIVLSFGYPATPRDPESRSPGEWSARANRKPLDEVVVQP